MVLMGKRTRLHLAASRVHKWLALIIGAQLLIWFSSGVLMSFLPIEKVRGEHLVDRERVVAVPATPDLVSPTQLLASAKAPVESISFVMLAGRPVAQVATADGIKLFDAVSGNPLPPVDATLAHAIASDAWKAQAKPDAKVISVLAESPEYRGTLPAWRVAFADPDNTSVFIAADTGKISAVRTGTWRLYDFFWSLHIMDWKNHENFNTWWLLTFAIGGLVMGLVGTILLVMRWPIRRKRRAA
ncbi:MAG: PepSY domain-containing protein [Sphingomonadales bacterium]|nr:PepSY domain-containing protein [Sphingomonadales bacterium]MBP6433549.1 PepSY domain-containing protein [Sphingorhabdus sp.]MCC6479334.1 PepSY domain-containing protein [Sphingomonadaceae bacterium]TXI83008.1 MAG: hypothetical protein E6Q44_00220 [Flavobacteriales bacterium]MBK9002474.1 PepSY domain-containing protein [Sphingomonadales bacterium]